MTQWRPSICVANDSRYEITRPVVVKGGVVPNSTICRDIKAGRFNPRHGANYAVENAGDISAPAAVDRGGNLTSSRCQGVASSRLKLQVINQIDQRISGLANTDETNNLWETRGDEGTGEGWVRNRDLWASGLDFSGVSPWNDRTGYLRGGTLITPMHVLYAEHYQLTHGDTLVFVDGDNNVVTRILGNHLHVRSDMHVGVLDSPVPNTIAHYPMVSATALATYLGGLSPNMGLPIILINQFDKVFVRDINSITGLNAGQSAFVSHLSSPSGTVRHNFTGSLIGGDSGRPGFLCVNNNLILLFTNWSAGTSNFAGHHVAEINSIVAALSPSGTRYRVDVYNNNLNCFEALSS